MSMYRIERIQEEILHLVRHILLFELVDPAFQGITLTRVTVTKDLSIARVYYEMVGSEKKKAVVAQALNRAQGLVRRQLASRLTLKKMPQIEFFYDELKEEVARVEDLFSKL